MPSPLKLKDVFTPGGLPSITYVSRDRLQLEKKVEDAVARGYAFNVITGPTKSGKSVLCKHVLRESRIVAIEGGQVRTEEAFWGQIAHRLQLPTSAAISRQGTTTNTLQGEGGGGIPALFQAKASVSHANADQTGSTRTYNKSLVIAAIDTLVAENYCLIVDDFHYIPADIQRNIIQALKGAVFAGLAVFLIAVPHRAFDPMTVENEVEGRFKHIAIPQWSLDDLIEIPSRGFPALNVELNRATQRKISEDSFGNPLLVQEICSEFCLSNGVQDFCNESKTLDASLLEPTYREMAQSKGFPTYQKLKSGPPGRRSRQLRQLKGGGQEDIYTAILTSVARLGPMTVTTFEEIRGSLRGLLAEDASMPPKGEIISGLTNMSSVAKERIVGEPPLEWISERSELVIIDPFLLFYLKWSFRDQGSGQA